MRKHIHQLTDLANALSDLNRIRLLAACLDGERCVCQLVELIELSNASVSKNLAVLKRAGLLESRKDGRWVHYRTPDTPAPLVANAIEMIQTYVREDAIILADQEKLKAIDSIDPSDLARMQRDGCCLPTKKECCHENQRSNP